ncbi:cytochrome P450 family protein [Heterostelium album PN500]|uniref:Cytochrome P450 family protein n=1 Tax=Heterostelium pallidum (strain ATCC 26659 / Pp 5 / PN500) TaxID=670386 RepID=D3BUV5_HETP5|nr:cytochrome P450 family protein [Heterostelium album PN500]EFA74893.1 cytochrome P450 family protein [Heterostelium album PN500]|eukprot:XP_020427027.1 cytochrome P450 family protein [Heterostelium album PN500]
MSSTNAIDYFCSLTKKTPINFNQYIKYEYVFVLFFMIIFILLDVHKRSHPHIKNSNKFAVFDFLYSIFNNRFHLFFRHQFEANPDQSIFKINLLLQDLIVITDPEYIKHVCNNRPLKYTRIEGLIEGLNGCGKNVFSGEGSQWSHHRKVTASQFNTFKLPKMEKPINQIVDRFVKKLETHTIEQPHQSVNFSKEVSSYTLDVLFKTGFGYDLNSIESGQVGTTPKIIKRLECVMGNITKRCLSPFHYWKYYTTFTESKFNKFLDLVKDFKNHFIQQDYAITEEAGLLHSLMVQMKQGLIDDDEIYANMLCYIIAGHDTSSKAISYAIWYLAKHPDILQKVKKEVVDVLANTENSYLSNKDIDKLQLLQQVLLESMRLKPLVSFILLECIEDDVVGDTEIYAGAQVVLTTEAVYRNAEYFPEPEEFKPERWEGVSFERCTDYNLFAFGYGPRMCPGRKMVRVQMLILFAKLIANFDIKLAENSIELVDEHVFVLSPEGGLNSYN